MGGVMDSHAIAALRRLLAALNKAEEGDTRGGLGPGYENGHGVEVGSELAAAREQAQKVLDSAPGDEFGQDPLGEPVFWYRPCSDGGYEGPIHNEGIERVRKLSGAWQPLYPKQAWRVPQALQLDAARWSVASALIAGERSVGGRERFVFNLLKPVAETIMRGSVSEHFRRAIDSELVASGVLAEGRLSPLRPLETFDAWLGRVQPAGSVCDMERGWRACEGVLLLRANYF